MAVAKTLAGFNKGPTKTYPTKLTKTTVSPIGRGACRWG